MQSKLERIGGFLVILALASVFAWLLGRRFPLTEYQPWTAIILAVIGFAVIFVGVRQELATTGPTSDAPGRPRGEAAPAPPVDRGATTPPAGAAVVAPGRASGADAGATGEPRAVEER